MKELFDTRLYEIASRAARGGKRTIKLILHRIMDSPDDYQENGVSWKEEYAVEAAKEISPSPIVVQYITKGNTADDTEISGHGLLGNTTDADGNPMPDFSDDSEVVGSITSASPETITIDGKETRVMMANGVLYEHRCKGLVAWLKKNVPAGNVMGSVEIVGLPENNNKIVYEDGFKDKGRVPMKYAYSGHAILAASVEPADDTCVVVEVNNNKEGEEMDEAKIRELFDGMKAELHAVFDKNEQLTSEINQVNAFGAEKDKEISEANDRVATLQAALDKVNEDINAMREESRKKEEEAASKWQELYEEKEILVKEIAGLKVEKRLKELDAALSGFTEDEVALAKDQVEAFKCDPVNSEVNSVVDVIYREIGKRDHKAVPGGKTVETNEHTAENIDIFSEIDEPTNANSDVSIF